MNTRLLLLSFLLLGALALGLGCPGPAKVTVGSPSPGEDVTTFQFDVVVDIAPDVDPASLEVFLNGQLLAMSGGPSRFTATISPGPPLRDDNQLRASVTDPGTGNRVHSTSDFRYVPAKARAHRISDPADLLRGPLAHGRIGDFLLGNALARYVVQDALPLDGAGNSGRDLHSVGTFGGNIIDAALEGRDGLDNFFELQPSLNATTVVNAQVVEVLNDGQDGLPAIIRSCGPDDLVDYINATAVVTDFGLPPDAIDNDDKEITGCTEYSLAPGERYVHMKTTIYNDEPGDVPLVVGDYINGMGELEPLFHIEDATGVQSVGIGEPTTEDLSLLSYFGFGRAAGASYDYVPIEVPGATYSTSFFGISGVAFILTSNNVLAFLLGIPPDFVVPAAVGGVPGTKSFERVFSVGDGSIAGGVDLLHQLRGLPTGIVEGRVTVGGVPRAGARVAVGVIDSNDPAVLNRIVTHWVTDENGRYTGTVQPGDYGVIAGVEGALFQGGGTDPQINPVHVDAGLTSTLADIDLPTPGALRVVVTDEAGLPVPARVAIVGFDPSPEPGRRVSGLADDYDAAFLNDFDKDAWPFGIVRAVYAGAAGVAEFDIEPGDYELVVTRGTEYSSYRAPLQVSGGQRQTVDAQIARVVSSPGFVSSDFHVHAINSPDSRINLTNRAMQFAGEGVDNIVMTEHDAHTDLVPHIAELGLAPFVHSTIGEEITTFDTGHFNGYPFTRDASRPSGGSTDWGRPAPPGDDFTEKGAFILTPAEVEAEARSQPTATPETVVQINHIGSHFGPLKIDTSQVPPFSYQSSCQVGEGCDRDVHRYDPTSTDNLFHHFAALELWNGATRGAQSEFLDDRIGIWMNHLNQGLATTAITDTDTHTFQNIRSGGGRSWTAAPAGQDEPSSLLPAHVATSVRQGRVVGGQGIYVQTRLLARDGSGAVADLGWNGSTLVASNAVDGVDLEIRVQAPAWAGFDTIEIYRNAATVPTGYEDVDPVFGVPGDQVPVHFTATPTKILREGDCDAATTGDGDFDVSLVDVAPGVPGALRQEVVITLPFTQASADPETALDGDSWFTVVVRGEDGVCEPMFPEMPFSLSSGSNASLADLLDGNLGEGGVMALGLTNALYADVDGTPGFQAPLGSAAPPAP